MKTLKTLSITAITFLLINCTNENKTDVTNNQNGTPTETTTNESTQPGSSTEDRQKTDAELILEAATVTIDLSKDAIENKRIKDSIKLANKEKMYAYQIGLPMKEKDDVFEAYKKLQTAEIKGIYVFQNPDDDYVLVQYEAKNKEDLKDGQESFKTTIADITSEKIEVINLVQFCGKKDNIKKAKNLTKRKEDVEIPCLICD